LADVFISYAQEDRPWVAGLAAAIERAGLTVWWDVRSTPGQAFDLQIEDELKRAKAVVVVWSREAVESRWVRAEASDAFDRGILVPVLKDPVTPPLVFRQLHCANLTRWDGESNDVFGAFMSEITRMVATPSAAVASGAVKLAWQPVEPRPRRGPILMLAAAALVAVAAAAFWLVPWSSPAAVETPPSAPPVAARDLDPAVAPRLKEVVKAAREAAALAHEADRAAAAAAGEADAAALDARKVWDRAKGVAGSARAAAETACTGGTPPDGYVCFQGPGGTSLRGEGACPDGTCVLTGFGVYEKAQWGRTEGRTENGDFTLGCTTFVIGDVYCGQLKAFYGEGSGVYEQKTGSIYAGAFKAGLPDRLGVMDHSATPDTSLDGSGGDVYRGGLKDGRSHGLGQIKFRNGIGYSGGWEDSILNGHGVYTANSGTVFAARFERGPAVIGVITYPDGRVFVGAIEDNMTLIEAHPREGVLYAADGTIAKQGRWKNNLLVEDFSVPTAPP
jgi:hypothetical protein